MSFKIIAVVAAVVVCVGVAWRVSAVLGKDTVLPPSMPTEKTPESATGPLALTMKDIDGKDVSLADYKGKVVMIVNVASRCGFTKQYAGLEALYKKYEEKGFVILGFPANNFGGQEPGSETDIKTFCSSKFGVTFPMFSKVSVKGDDQAPLYKFLTEPATNGDLAGPIGWNFTKFVIDRTGKPYARFGSSTTPEDAALVAAVEKGLGK